MRKRVLAQAVVMAITLSSIVFLFIIQKPATRHTLTGMAGNDPPDCSDGLMDNGEQGIDCGGQCSVPCEFVVRQGHPRLFVTPEDIPVLRCKVGLPGYESACPFFGNLSEQYQWLRARWVGHIDDHRYYFLLPFSFFCMMEDDPGFCAAAKASASSVLGTTPPQEGEMFGRISDMALFYDWDYAMLSGQERHDFGEFLKNGTELYINIPRGKGYNYPWQPISEYTGFPLSIYGDGIDDTLAFKGMNESYYWYTRAHFPVMDELMPGGCVKGYAGVRTPAMVYTAELFRTALNQDFYPSSSFLRNAGRAYLYRTRDDGVIADGPGKYNVDGLGSESPIFAARNRDPYLQKFANYYLRNYAAAFDSASPDIMYYVLFYDPALQEAASFDGLPKSWLCAPVGVLYSRDATRLPGQDYSGDIHAGFFNGPSLVSGETGAQNHLILARGNDTLLIHGADYKESDAFCWFSNWFGKTISYNGLLVYDPAEYYGNCRGIPLDNDGGARRDGDTAIGMARYPLANRPGTVGVKYRGEITRYEETALYVYARGENASYAYTAGKVSEWTRDFVHVLPDIIVTFDKVVTPDPTMNKTIVFHVVERPALDGQEAMEEGGAYGGIFTSLDSSTFTADRGTSRVFGKTLLPGIRELRRIGGANSAGEGMRQDTKPFAPVTYSTNGHSYEWYLAGKNQAPSPDGEADHSEYTLQRRDARNDDAANPAGDWRVEIQSKEGISPDYFLEVIEAAPRTRAQMVAASLLASQEGNLAGALINGSVAVLFAKEDDPGAATITMPKGGMFSFIVVGLPAFQAYGVSVDGYALHLTKGGNDAAASGQGVFSFTLSFDTADADGNGCIDNGEMAGFAERWLTREDALHDLIAAIHWWKEGCNP